MSAALDFAAVLSVLLTPRL